MGVNRLIAITNGQLVDPAGTMVEPGTLLLQGDGIIAAGKVERPASSTSASSRRTSPPFISAGSPAPR
jgi:hypothetical protein